MTDGDTDARTGRGTLTCRAGGGRSSTLLPLGGLRRHSLDVGLVDGQQDVLWFDVCVDDFTLGVEVVQPLQDLQHKDA